MAALNSIAVVLYQPKDANNIGAVIRAMSNFGLSRLRLVEPADWHEGRVRALAHGCEAIISRVERCPDLDSALSDCGFVAGTSRRPREPERERLDPRAAAAALVAAAATRPGERFALLFGPEEDGLPRAALDRCHALVTIPTAPGNASLNLAQAVLVLCYELWRAAAADAAAPSPTLAALAPAAPEPLAAGPEREAAFAALGVALAALQPRIPARRLEHTLARLRALLLRAAPRREEARALAAFFGQIAQRLQRRPH